MPACDPVFVYGVSMMPYRVLSEESETKTGSLAGISSTTREDGKVKLQDGKSPSEIENLMGDFIQQ